MNYKKKGFTLVELIVVLAILAILAAMLVPALTGYIDKANEKKVVSITRQVAVAAQTVVSEKYAANSDFKEGSVLALASPEHGASFDLDKANNFNIGEICELAEVASNLTKTKEEYQWPDKNGNNITFNGDKYSGNLINGITYIIVSYDSKGKVTRVTLEKDGIICNYDGATGEYTIN